ncbi:MAG: hypothetical protein K2H22_03295 [Muribaculaceae bacterium]|nr:hypothetical protein [Muribaculaceae bacterium]
MKKFTLFCAAVAAAMSVNAQDTALTAEMWHQWTGFGADATIIEGAETGLEYNIGKELGEGNMVIGQPMCNGDVYADLTAYEGIEGVATPGVTIRFFFNRDGLQGPGIDTSVDVDTEGKFTFMFSELGDVEFVHLNFIKILEQWRGGKWPAGLEKCVVESMNLIPKETPVKADAITAAWWHKWTGWGADATIIEDADPGCEYNIGKELGEGNIVLGNPTCDGDLYADLTEYEGIEGVATPGITVRFFFNRDGLQGPGIDTSVDVDADGKFTFMFSELGNVEFVHLNFVKILEQWRGGKWPAGLEKCVVSEFNAISKGSSVNVIDTETSNVVLYNIYGQRVSENYRGIVIKNGKKYINK